MVVNPKLQEAESNQEHYDDMADGVDITYYTDPLCCWSWAFEPEWRRLQYEFGDKIKFRYCMSGLLPSWKNFHDPINSVNRPIQMGPVWMHAAQLSGMPIQHNIWMKEHPVSSYPACIAVKAVELQSAIVADRYLRLLREAVMLNGRNISKEKVLVEVAEQLTKEFQVFNLKLFNEDLHNDKALEAFRSDLQQVKYYSINRFPTLVIRKAGKTSVILSGYRPYALLLEAVQKVSPNIKKIRKAETPSQYASHWQSILPREVAEGISS